MPGKRKKSGKKSKTYREKKKQKEESQDCCAIACVGGFRKGDETWFWA